MAQQAKKTKYDVVIIGSGFGGSMVAKPLVEAGLRVAMIERGGWVKRGPENWSMNSSIDLTPHYDKSLPYQVVKGGNKKEMGVYACVGGPSVFYGGVSFRFREDDFDPPAEILAQSGARWPIRYGDIEPYYNQAERILNVSGRAGIDPTEPRRTADFPQEPGQLSKISEKVKSAAESYGLHPFDLPLAINYEDASRSTCAYCTTCDTFACAVEAKNDLATVLLPSLIEQGLDLYDHTLATKLIAEQGRIVRLQCFQREEARVLEFTADQFILSAGALASPHLLLASGLAAFNPGGETIGRYLMRHVNAIVFGIFPKTADTEFRFHKQLAILDYYFGHPSKQSALKKLGSLQQVPTPPAGLVQNEVPGAFGRWISKAVRLLTGLLVIAEDQPQFENRIYLDTKKDASGMVGAKIWHTYSNRDLLALRALSKEARKIMSRTGAIWHYTHHIRTFSHAVGTVRMGEDPRTSALDRHCKFRGLSNLYVVDGSFMPTSAAVNPSLTISANALRVGQHICALE